MPTSPGWRPSTPSRLRPGVSRGTTTAFRTFRPTGLDERAELQRTTLAAVATAPKATEADRIAAEVMAERLTSSLELHEAGDEFRSLRVLHSPQESVRRAFDLMPLDSEADWQVVAARLRAVPSALEGLRAHPGGRARPAGGVARRQVVACAAQCDTWGGRGDEHSSFFARLVRRYPGGPSAAELERGARTAAGAYLEFGAWLRQRLPARRHAGRSCRPGALRPRGPLFHRLRSRPRGHLSIRVGRAAPHRGADGSGVRADRARSVAGGGHRSSWRPIRTG